MSVWRAAQAGDGRTYYYHTQTKQTQWTKPDDFDEPEAPAKAAVPIANDASESGDWAEAVAGDGRKYYYNSKTRETSWEAPAGFTQQQQRATPQTNQVAGPTYVAGGAPGFGGRDHGGSDQRMDRQERGHGLPQKPSFDGPRSGNNPWERQEHAGFRGSAAAKPDEPEFSSAEAAESAFFKVLREHNVTPDMRWTDAFRKIFRDREARAIKDPKERMLAFERYCHEVRAEEKIKERERRDRLREDFRKMLATHEEVKHYTRWKTARASIEREAVFKAAGDEDEKRSMFEEYIYELKKQHAEKEASRRKAAVQELDAMLKALVVDSETKWSEAQTKIMENERFKSEDNFKALHSIDVLSAFDNHMKDLDRVANDAKQATKRMRARRERRARDDFQALLAEKSREGKIKAGTKWQDFRASIIDDERFRSFIGTPGSTVLEMFWDVVEDNEDKLRSKRGVALDVLESARFEMTTDTTLDEFMSIMREHTSTKGFDEEDLTMIYERLIAKINKRAEKEKHEAELLQKAAVDDLRSLMREVHPPIRLDHSYDDVMQKLAGYREYKHANESARKTAYEKYMRRLKEREEHDRDRDRDRARRERDRETNGSSRRGHDRDRDDRPRRTRSPEMDAYEADRKRAQADRERHYRTGSFGLGSPSRDRRDDRHSGRLDRYEAYSHYDRERRDREVEREHSYVSRADPRDQTKALNYGDDDVVGSRPGSVRKRQDSDASFDSKRDSKRSRRDRRTATVEPEPAPKEDAPELQSGSEEGEIEEV